MFWEVDQAGIDFSDNVPVTVQRVKASSSTEGHGWEVGHLLAADDDQYLKQFMVGEEVLLTFPVPANTPGNT